MSELWSDKPPHEPGRYWIMRDAGAATELHVVKVRSFGDLVKAEVTRGHWEDVTQIKNVMWSKLEDE